MTTPATRIRQVSLTTPRRSSGRLSCTNHQPNVHRAASVKTVAKLARIADEINSEQRVDHGLYRQRDELQCFKGFVGEREPTDLGKRPELLKNHEAGSEVHVREKEREGEGKRQRQPPPDEVDVESEADAAQAKDLDDNHGVGDRERVRRGVSPYVIGDT